MKSLLTFIFIISVFGTLLRAQNINQKDAQGKRTGKWIIYQKGTKIIYEEGTFISGRKEGTWKRYYPDGKTVEIEAAYKNNRPTGGYTKYYKNGIIQEKGSLVLNQYKDSLSRYYPNGTLEYSGNFNQTGKEQGKIRYFYDNGNLEYEYEAFNGAPTGKATRYFENGKIKEEISYSTNGSISSSVKTESGTTSISAPSKTAIKAPSLGTPRTRGKTFLPNGYNKCYTPNDEIWQDGQFKNGQLWEGKVYEYDKDGILIKVKIYKAGFYHSDGQL